MAETRRWRIEGRVQGVFFRASTRRQAEPLGLSGHAINLADGAVEVLAHGEAAALDALEAWLSKGPAAARVDRVESLDPGSAIPSPGFRTG
ncbi:acylphosphatase [Wenzhouxiangella marina]|uniref:acylphosphatase n=1 Tax=Wenzhouxiangella marina TaxID=1579979 RepID=A0A0K0XT58_9GAMM|nr:acylphosphatase [Wenzhouxiangella marina]AKS40807.1 acylphosphatase [Wenzhouxiangella marina]MBB6087681.1 acylphosphatase [Wenzhouxiangella marina]